MAGLFGRGSRATRSRAADFQAGDPSAILPTEYLDAVAFAAAERRGENAGLGSDDPQILEWADENYAAALASRDAARLADEDPAAVDLDASAGYDPAADFDTPPPPDMNGLRPVFDAWVEMVEVGQMAGTSPDRIGQAGIGYEVAAGYARDAGLDPADSGGPYELRFLADSGTTGTVLADDLLHAQQLTRLVQDSARAQGHTACLGSVTYQGQYRELDVPEDIVVAVGLAAQPHDTHPALPAPQEQPTHTLNR